MKDEEKTKKQLIKELKALRQNYNNIPLLLYQTIEVTTDFIAVIDVNGYIVFLNPAGRRALGFSCEEDLSKVKIIEYYAEGSIPTLVNEALPTASKTGIWAGEIVLITKNRSKELHVSQKIFSHMNPVGEVDFFSTISRDITKFKDPENILRESEKRYHSLINSMPEGIIYQLANGEISACNRSAQGIFGMTEDQMLGQISLPPNWKTIHEDGSPFPEEAYPSLTALKTGETKYNVVMGVSKPDELTMWLSINSTPLFQENEPSPYAVLTTLSDITERKRADRMSRQAAAITANIQTGLHVYHLDNIEDSSTLRLFACNKAAEEITGIPSKDLIGRTLDQNFPGLRQLEIPQKYAEVVRSGKPINLDKVIFGNDRIQASTYSVRVFPLPGNCVGAAFEDVSQQSIAVEQLENSEKHYRELYENSPLGYLSLDIEGRFIAANASLCWMLGIERSEIIGRWFGDFLTPESSNLFKSSFPKFKADGKVGNLTFDLVAKNGKIFSVEISGRIGYDDKQSFKQAHCVLQDTSERKQLENQLLQAMKMESLGILTGGIAHEFNNLLSPILGFTEMMIRKKSRTDPDLYKLEQVQIAGNRATVLVKQMLAYGRHSQSQKEVFQLDTVVEKAIKLHENMIPSNISIIKRIEPNLPSILGISDDIHQVLINLCINASQAMPDGGEITISLVNTGFHEFVTPEGLKRRGDYCCLSVRDTGSGIEEQNLSRIFDPFFTTKEVGEGTGLGLSVVQGITDQHKGKIEVESSKGKGTTFSIYLPIEKDEKKKPDEKHKVIPKGSGGILLIDDDPMINDLLRNMLEALGYHVKDFIDCDEAIEYFTIHYQEFDLIISDYGMPKMSGRKLIEELKKICPEIPAILLTGYGNLIDKEDLQTWSIENLLTKPFKISELSDIVRTTLDSN